MTPAATPHASITAACSQNETSKGSAANGTSSNAAGGGYGKIARPSPCSRCHAIVASAETISAEPTRWPAVQNADQS